MSYLMVGNFGGANFREIYHTEPPELILILWLQPSLQVIVDTWVTGKHKLCCTRD